MPRYSYKCKECDHVLDTMHSYKIVLENCPECGSEKTLEKIINNFTTTIQGGSRSHNVNINAPEIGSVVKEKIEDFKNELKQEKKRLSRQEYADQ